MKASFAALADGADHAAPGCPGGARHRATASPLKAVRGPLAAHEHRGSGRIVARSLTDVRHRCWRPRSVSRSARGGRS